MKTRIIPALLVCLMASGASLAASGDDINWPQFRGPNAAGTRTNANLPDQWSPTNNVAWKTELPGRSWSSPIVWGDRIYPKAISYQ